MAAIEGTTTVTVTPITDQSLLPAIDGSGSVAGGSHKVEDSVALPGTDDDEQADVEQVGEQDHPLMCQPNDTTESTIRLAIYGDELYGLRFGMCTMKDAPPGVKHADSRGVSSAENAPSSDIEGDNASNGDATGSKPPTAAPSSSSNPPTGAPASNPPGAGSAFVANATKVLSSSTDAIASGGGHAKSNSSSTTTSTSVLPPTASSSTTSVSTATQVASGVSTAGSTQSLGRLENIFVRITKKSKAAFTLTSSSWESAVLTLSFLTCVCSPSAGSEPERACAARRRVSAHRGAAQGTATMYGTNLAVQSNVWSIVGFVCNMLGASRRPGGATPRHPVHVERPGALPTSSTCQDNISFGPTHWFAFVVWTRRARVLRKSSTATSSCWTKCVATTLRYG